MPKNLRYLCNLHGYYPPLRVLFSASKWTGWNWVYFWNVINSPHFASTNKHDDFFSIKNLTPIRAFNIKYATVRLYNSSQVRSLSDWGIMDSVSLQKLSKLTFTARMIRVLNTFWLKIALAIVLSAISTYSHWTCSFSRRFCQ